jgi:hypothetical protein
MFLTIVLLFATCIMLCVALLQSDAAPHDAPSASWHDTQFESPPAGVELVGFFLVDATHNFATNFVLREGRFLEAESFRDLAVAPAKWSTLPRN